ncbi:growth factor receptor-bound protein 10-like [Alosa sapidissima]|uniref:growth factor receptor-bound protein 10-like n=1 Tax=Alosa sapidissima TaxID=34773 RepID=UPI001C083050|nr:growth factor receptor-bound protein 10-like [Alosa sapidissima]
MALAGCPDFFVHQTNYQDKVDRSGSHQPSNLIGSGFQQSSNRNSPSHQDDDVDLEALVNDMNSSFESLYSHTDSSPLLHNGHAHMQGPYGNRGQAMPPQRPPPRSPGQRLRRSQPIHVHAVRRLQEEEHQVRPASLPAIPNPFPELCSPTGSPILDTLQQNQASDTHVRKHSRGPSCES